MRFALHLLLIPHRTAGHRAWGTGNTRHKPQSRTVIQAANTVLDSEPDNVLTRLRRGVAFQDLGRSQEALADFNAALSEKSRPDLGRFLGFAYYRRGATLAMLDQQEKAIADFDVVLSSNRDGATFASRAMCFSTLGKTKEAIADYRSAIEITSKFPHVFNGLAWLLATSSDDALRNGSEAVEYARKACELTGWKDGDYIDTLAAAFAETGDFESAVKYQKQAMELMQGDATDTTERLHLYEAAKPFRQNTAKSEKPLTEQWEAMGT